MPSLKPNSINVRSKAFYLILVTLFNVDGGNDATLFIRLYIGLSFPYRVGVIAAFGCTRG
jgi:hypothetical protein